MEENTNKEITTTKKKRTLTILLVILLLLLLTCGGMYMGYRKIVKAMEPVDLGVTYSQNDFDSLLEDIGVEADPSDLCLDCPIPYYSNSTEISTKVSSTQASAAFQYINEYLSAVSIKGTQIKIKEGEAELSTTIIFKEESLPVYMSGTIYKNDEKSVGGEIYDVRVGALKIPKDTISYATEILLDIVNERLSTVGDGLRIDKIELKDGYALFEGMIPTKVTKETIYEI